MFHGCKTEPMIHSLTDILTFKVGQGSCFCYFFKLIENTCFLHHRENITIKLAFIIYIPYPVKCIRIEQQDGKIFYTAIIIVNRSHDRYTAGGRVEYGL